MPTAAEIQVIQEEIKVNKPKSLTIKPLTLEQRLNKLKKISADFVNKNIRNPLAEDYERFEKSFLEDFDPNKVEYNLPKTYDEYILMQIESGLKRGDKVKIIGRAESGEHGWDNSWSSCMNPFINHTFIINEVCDNGVYLKNTGCKFPFFVLEKVENKE